MIVRKKMTNFRVFLLVFFILNSLLSCKEKGDTTAENDFINDIPIWCLAADSVFIIADSLSGVLLVAENGKEIIHHSKGFQNYNDSIPIKNESVFELASVSKQFTAAAIMVLAQQGKLNYDDNLIKFFPDLPYKEVTIRQMLHHTSGLPDYMVLFDKYWDKTKVAGNNEILDYLKKYSPSMLFEPGEKYEYSNTGYVLLASIVERVAQTNFTDFVKKELFNPAGMSDTAIRTKSEKLAMPSMAWGNIFDVDKNQYMVADSFPYTDYATYLGARKGPGRVSSTTEDLLKWDTFLRSGKLFNHETLMQAYSPSTLNNGTSHYYGFGWDIHQAKNGEKIIAHNGVNPGYRTYYVRYPEKKRIIVLLTNNQPPNFDRLMKQMLEIIEK